MPLTATYVDWLSLITSQRRWQPGINHEGDHIALRPQKRVCLLGTGTGGARGGEGGGGRKSEGSTADTARLRKTGETVNRRQNNGSVKAVSPRHCPATD